MSQSYNWPMPGCVGLWHLNGDLDDGSGYDNHGYGTDITWPSAKFGLGAYLEEGAYMIVSDDASLHTTNFTISAWYKGTDAGAYNTIYSTIGRYTGPTYYLYYGLAFDVRAGHLAIGTSGGDYNLSWVNGTKIVNDGEWHWCVATPGKIYVDGYLDVSGSGHPGWYGTHSVRIGALYWSGATDFLNGQLDEVVLLNYVLTADQIRRAYLFQIGAL